jgi:hypothetical protein
VISDPAKVWTAHKVYRYEEDTNPSGLLLGVFASEASAKAECEEASENDDNNDYTYHVTEHEVMP